VSTEPAADALVEEAVAVANSILQGETDPYRGAKRLWAMEVALVLVEEDLRVFAGLASEWEDVPNQREEYEREIVAAADRFRARWGR
jgi:hypothetical protein